MKYYHSYNKREKSPEKKDEKEEEPAIVCKMNKTDYQRMKIDKIFNNPEKATAIFNESVAPPPVKTASDFVRNVWGSAAGVGSGDFHVYRGVRRREFARQELVKKELEDERIKTEYNALKKAQKEDADAKTAKKRVKRQKAKERLKKRRLMKNSEIPGSSSSSSESENSHNFEENKEGLARIDHELNNK